jgi:hypothetical protein
MRRRGHTVTSQIGQVDARGPHLVGSDSFQSKEVKGAQNSECRF